MRTESPVLPVYVSPFKRLFTTIHVRIGIPFKVQNEDHSDGAAYRAVASDILNHVKRLGSEI